MEEQAKRDQYRNLYLTFLFFNFLHDHKNSRSRSPSALAAAAAAGVKSWFDEVDGFDPGNIDPFRSAGGRPITGHYTQVRTYLIK